jgi:soluble lytic murein transglycosylase-like protein
MYRGRELRRVIDEDLRCGSGTRTRVGAGVARAFSDPALIVRAAIGACMSARLLGILILFPALAAMADGGAPRRLDADQIRSLAARYEHAEGVPRDYQRAYRLYCLAATQGDAKAQYSLAWMYINGRGVPQDDSLAAGWLRVAARQRDGLAHNVLRLLRSVEPRPDPNCPLGRRARGHGRLQVEAWVAALAPEFDLDPELVLAVIEAESAFQPHAHSPKDARGLMQLIPETASRLGVRDVWDALDNLRGGMRYLHQLLVMFGGDLRLTLAAYNAGEKAVERFNGVPPYQETQSYVRRITGRYGKDWHPVPGLISSSASALR